MGGTCDGAVFRIAFRGSSLEKAYDMVRAFLSEEGYADVPLPVDAAELKRFKRPRRPQAGLFDEIGYCHNPVKILFPAKSPGRGAVLEVWLYNEAAPGHLLRFHGLDGGHDN
jgi:hypothetical protein